MDFIKSNLLAIDQRIAQAATDADRPLSDVTMIAASKTQPAEIIESAYKAGVRDFGENYLDEALSKRQSLSLPDARWHFIGRIQSNKTKLIAQNFDWVHTIDRLKIAQRLSTQKTEAKAPLNILIQVNIDSDPAKAGAHPDQVVPLIEQIEPLSNLALRGLMTILDPKSKPATSYQSMAQLFTDIRSQIHPDTQWDTLSMGMSGDMAEAIAAGATHVRIGTALFGPRT